jgi:hypothetical protein
MQVKTYEVIINGNQKKQKDYPSVNDGSFNSFNFMNDVSSNSRTTAFA